MNKPIRSSSKIILFIVSSLLIYFIFYSYIWQNAPILSGDSFGYIDLAKKIKDGSLNAPHERLIGYPLLLLITGSIPQPSRILYYASLIFHLIGISLLAYILYDLKVSIKLIYVYFLILLLPPYTESAAYVLTENLTEVILALIVFLIYLYGKYRYNWLMMVCGIFCAISLTVRPTYLALSLILVPILIIIINSKSTSNRLIKRKYLAVILLLTLPSFFIVGTYSMFNYKNYGYFGITPKSGFMLFTRTLGFLERIPDKNQKIREILIEKRNNSLIERNSSHKGSQFVWGKAGSINNFFVEATGKKPEQIAGEMLKININLILSAPLEYLSTVTATFSNIWLPSATKISQFNSKIIQMIFTFFHFVIISLYIVFLIFFIEKNITMYFSKWGVCYRNITVTINNHIISGSSVTEWVCFIVIMYTAVISSAVDVGDPRYMKPVMPLVLLVVCLFLSQWKKCNNNQATI